MDPPLFKDGSQVASRPLQARFWRGLGTILGPFSLVFLANVWCFLHAFFSSMLQSNMFKMTRTRQTNAAESFQEAASLFVPSCIEKLTGERKVAFRSLLVQVETGQMSAAEIGQMSAVDTRQMLKSQTRGRASQQQCSKPGQA